MIRRKKTEVEKTKLQLRIAKIDTPELVNWADQALFGIGRNISDWNKNSEFVYLGEAKQGAEALLAVIDELIERNNSTRNF